MTERPDPVPVMDIGGTHVTVALFDPSAGTVLPDGRHRRGLDAHASSDVIIAQIADCANALHAPASAVWGVAVPGPFDYATGIARYHGVGKFDSLNGVDLGRALRESVAARPAAIRFLNDASAFGLGEVAPGGAASGAGRVIGLTLGTGIGSVFLDHGVVVEDRPDVPPEGRVDLLRIGEAPLEDTVSRRAIIARYAALTGAGPTVDIDAIAARAAAGEDVARRVLSEAFGALGDALRPWVRDFGAEVLVLGGSVAGARDLVVRPLRERLGGLPVVTAAFGDDAALVGAGRYAYAAETR